MIERGEIYFAQLDPARGREQAGRRPVLVVSSDAINRVPLVVTVIVGTDARNVARDYAVNVRVPSTESGLPQDTVFLGFQIRSIDPDRVRDARTGVARATGRLSPTRMAEVDHTLRLALSL